MISKKSKYFIVLFILTIFSIVLSGSIDYENSSYSNMDFNKYITMAKAAPGIETEVKKPFAYRIIAPWFAGILPFSVQTSFIILNYLSLFILSIVFYLFLIKYKIDERLALIVTFLFQLNRYLFQFLGWNYFQLSDTLSLSLLFYSFILLHDRKYLILFFVIVLGVLVKEYMVLFIPAGFIFLYEKKLPKMEYLYFLVISLASLSLFWGVRQVIVIDSGVGLFSQYIDEMKFYLAPPFLIKRFIIPFSPFGLLPILFYKDLFFFFQKNKHLFMYVLTVIVLSFFGEPERLMAPLYPVFFLFIANLISKFIVVNSKRGYLNRDTVLIIGLTFFTSFYHLWGVVKLSNKYYSMASALLFTITLTIYFYNLKIVKCKKTKDKFIPDL